jgi:hypothetical protein
MLIIKTTRHLLTRARADGTTDQITGHSRIKPRVSAAPPGLRADIGSAGCGFALIWVDANDLIAER